MWTARTLARQSEFMTTDWKKQRTFGATGLQVSRLGLGSSYGLSTYDVERAFDRGVNLLFWGLRRRGGFGRAIQHIGAVHRDRIVVAVQSYTRVGALMRPFLESALCSLRLDHVDVLTLGWWNDLPPRRIIDAALSLKEQGKVRHLMVSCHHRPAFEKLAKEPAFDAIMVRYNAAHPGAERDVFPVLGARDPGVLAFTATRWGTLLDPRRTPEGESTPRGSDCYRFALSDPHVHSCLAGPKDAVELDEALAALDRGPMSAEELAWMRRVGQSVRTDTRANRPIRVLDRAYDALFGDARG